MTTAIRITQRELESYLWGAATLLRGTIDAGDYKQFIFPLLFYKRLCDVHDEETRAALDDSGGDEEFAAFPQNHRFQVPPEAHWRATRKVSTNVGRALARSFRAIENANSDQLFGIFGDAQWTNKERLPDSMLRDLIEHFSILDLAIANLPEDELGVGYEYLIKKFADDSGHTAAEFYTNRTVVHLMTELLQPQPGESIYDPTCGTGGMLISAVAQLQRRGEEWRNVRLYGQERNLMTSSIARMNCFLHGIEEFRIERGDTLSEPKFVDGDRLMRFDVVLANPPYSIKQWDREAFSADPWGRNRFGTPPQGRADYAFWQHIIESMDAKTGRCAILFPHGVLFRQEEAEMRRALIEADLVEAVIGLGPNLFYNSPMESCVVICRSRKPAERRGKVLLINAVNEVTRERAQSFLTQEHIQRIVSAYQAFEDMDGFARVLSNAEVQHQGGNLSIPLYVSSNGAGGDDPTDVSVAVALDDWVASAIGVRQTLGEVLNEPIPAFPALRPAVVEPEWLRREEWERLAFGEIVDQIAERVDPADAEGEIYVGLEHLDPGDLHLRRWGTASDVTGTKLRFQEGDVIFGRRRAYQRKLAVAGFDGICSAHAMVVRAKPDRILPEFLPFFMMSDRFMERAIEISVGSLSPTINWTTLKREEFDLPPLDVQRRLAELLWAVDEVIERCDNVTAELASSLRTIASNAARSTTRSQPLGDVAVSVTSGSRGWAQYYSSVGALFVRITNLRRGSVHIDWSDKQYVDPPETKESVRTRIDEGDLLISITADVGIVAVCENLPDLPAHVNQHVAKVRLDATKADPYVTAHVLSVPPFADQFVRLNDHGAKAGMNLKNVASVRIPDFTASERSHLAGRLRSVEGTIDRVATCSNSLKALRAQLLQRFAR